MEELPIAAGLQIINAEMMSRGIPRCWAGSGSSHFDSAVVIDEAFKNLIKR